MEDYLFMNISALERELVQDYLQATGGSITASDDDRARYLQAIRKALRDSVDAIDENSRKYICERLRYCSRKNSDGVSLVSDLIDGGIMAYFNIPIPPVKIAFYVVRVGYLDELCDC